MAVKEIFPLVMSFHAGLMVFLHLTKFLGQKEEAEREANQRDRDRYSEKRG